MLKPNKVLLINILAILLIFTFLSTGYANSAEPPSILIIVPNAPQNLEIGIGSDNMYSKANVIDKGLEKYFVFYSRELRAADNYTLQVKTEGNTFEMPMDKPLKSYNNVFTLDIKNKSLTSGKLLTRSIILVGLRVILTLVIEALVFYLMGFRLKKSWIAFLAINLITQGALNIWINGFSPLGSYIIVSLLFGEVLVFLLEIVAFPVFVQEHRWWRKIFYVLLANTLSLIAGGYIISILPV